MATLELVDLAPLIDDANASVWCASIAGRRASAALPAGAVPGAATAATTPSRTGNATAARRAWCASTTSPARCWPAIISRYGSGCCASTSWA